jgi:hypothetical protein
LKRVNREAKLARLNAPRYSAESVKELSVRVSMLIEVQRVAAAAVQCCEINDVSHLPRDLLYPTAEPLTMPVLPLSSDHQ